MKIFLLQCVALLSLSVNGLCQKHTVKFRHLNNNDGLSQNYVTAIYQDSRGFMWFGTGDGLNKYDGYKFTIYKSDAGNPYSISDNEVKQIIEDEAGNLWIATINGLNRFDRYKEQFTRYKHDENNSSSISGNYINAICIDSKGNLWIGAGQGGVGRSGLNLYDRENNKFIYYPNLEDSSALNEDDVTRIYEDSRQNLWIGTATEGLYLFDALQGKFHSFNDLKNGPGPASRISAIFEDSKNNLWIGVRNRGLYLLDRDTRTFRHFTREISDSRAVLSIHEDNSGNLWVGTENGGLSILNFQNGAYTTYVANDVSGLNSNSIYSLFTDKTGNVWVGTYNGGINHYNLDGNKFIHYQKNAIENSLSNNTIFCIREDSKGNLLIATDGGGLNVYEESTGDFTYLKNEVGNPKSICGNYVLSVLEDSYGNIWVGTWGDGATMFNRETNSYKHFKHDPSDPNSLGGNNAWFIYEDSKKNIWIGPYWNGLSKYDRENDQFIQYKREINNPNTISSNLLNSVFEDSKGNLWIGTANAGLDRFDVANNEFMHFVYDEEKNSISNNVITSICEDSLGNLWIGTSRGLNYLETDSFKFTAFTTKDGLPNDFIRGILDDSKGHLWVSTNNGFTRFHVETKIFKNFTVADGLQGQEFKTHAAWKSRSGTMYFGGTNGFNRFYPDSIKDISYDPPLIFTDFQIFNRPVPIGDEHPLKQSVTETKEIILSYKESVFSLEFASLNYTERQKKQYAYQLEGFDEDWNYVGIKRTAAYTNLNSGKYVFKVKGLTNEGEWSPNIAEIKITITPPFWETVWFKSIILFFIFGLVYGWYALRVGQIKRQKAALKKQVDERTAELLKVNIQLNNHSQALTLQAEHLGAANEEITRQQQRLERLYLEMKDSIRAAQVIQNSILPTEDLIKKHLPESFIFYKPKDVVGGDFYWFEERNDQIIIAAADCTGHGVSGAFMSINGYHLLNQIVHSSKEMKASKILKRLNDGINETFHFDEDLLGMDIALCIIDYKTKVLQFSGASSHLYIFKKGSLVEIKGDKLPLGFNLDKNLLKFTDHDVPIETGDVVYLFSDGYADQIGGESNEKLMYPRFREILSEVHSKDFEEQGRLIETKFDDWKGGHEQLDDVLIIGFKIA